MDLSLRKYGLKKYKKDPPGACNLQIAVAWFCIWLCKAGDGSHRPVLQQRAVVHSSTSVQKTPEHRGHRAAVSPAGLRARRHNHVFLQGPVRLKASVEQNTKIKTG